ncbi:MAG: hypothetical protein ACI87W_003651, partial [Halieaceae bacterium]
FGDLHIHTGFSYDALPLGIKTTPADAYRFAKGKPLAVPPFDEKGAPQSVMQLRTPLDFAAVTDHAEFFGEFALCTDVASAVYDAPSCAALRGEEQDSIFAYVRIVLSEEPKRIVELCGQDGAACRAASVSPWRDTQDMAEAAYDRSSACEFTSFIAYEHTGTPNANNAHRNVIFRNSTVPEQATSYVEAPTGPELWAQLTKYCLEGLPGCDVLAIPHNSNISAGAMFAAYARTDASTAAQRAALRNVMEPIVEIFQHKGNSECFNGMPGIFGAPDELCNEEQVVSLGEKFDRDGVAHLVEFCEEDEVGKRGFSRFGCISKNDFFRSVLLTGLQDEAAIGVNSYRLGVIASTDTHTSVSGATDEKSYQGHLVNEATLTERLTPSPWSPQLLDGNPGGLAGVWAVENSRDALFNAMEQREVFGTSGTRIRPRMFAGWEFADNACELDDIAAHGYQHGVPMGSDMTAAPPGGKARFLLTAGRDPNAAPLQKLQLIKGWVDGEGNPHYKVVDVAGAGNTAGSVDLATGQWSGGGAASLCAVFEDAEFDSAQSAYYYLRAVEIPTLRWSWAQCVALPAEARPAQCENDAPKTIQEMAWSSPIWYSPIGHGGN